MAATRRQPLPSARPTVTKAKWAGRAIHTAECPSGAWVRIRIPDLSLLLAGDAVPADLRSTAVRKVMEELGEAPDSSQNGSQEPAAAPEEEPRLAHLQEMVELYRWLVTEMLIDPEYTYDEIKDPLLRPPDDDLAFLIAIATRRRATDAGGRALGVMPLGYFERFRHWHKCPQDCPACAEGIQEFSTLDVDEM